MAASGASEDRCRMLLHPTMDLKMLSAMYHEVFVWDATTYGQVLNDVIRQYTGHGCAVARPASPHIYRQLAMLNMLKLDY